MARSRILLDQLHLKGPCSESGTCWLSFSGFCGSRPHILSASMLLEERVCVLHPIQPEAAGVSGTNPMARECCAADGLEHDGFFITALLRYIHMP